MDRGAQRAIVNGVEKELFVTEVTWHAHVPCHCHWWTGLSLGVQR